MTSTLQGTPISPTPPTVGQVLTLAGGIYTPATPGGGGGVTVLANVIGNTSVVADGTDKEVITSGAVVCTAGKKQLVIFECDVSITAAYTGSVDFKLLVDGVQVAGKAARKASGAFLAILPVSLKSPIQTGLSAGAHTFNVTFNATNLTATTNSDGGATTPTLLQVLEF